jgi:hypothetical protein
MTPMDLGAPADDRRMNLHVNGLGFLQFGLTPTFEFGGARVSGLTWIRIMNTGLLNYVITESEESFIWGIGLGGGVRGYFLGNGSQRGLYIGGALEYVYTQLDDDSDDMASYTTHSLVPEVEIGYRWVWTRFLLGLGARAGAAIPVASDDEPIGPYGCQWDTSCLGDRDTRFVGHLALDIGWFL